MVLYTFWHGLGLDLVCHVGVDYQSESVNIYFHAPGPILADQAAQLVALAGSPLPSQDGILEMRTMLKPSGFTFEAVGWLLSVPRASSTVLEVTIPYSRISMLQLLGKTPVQSVSRETAEEIAVTAYCNRALGLSMPDVPVAGIGFTGALVSDTPKRVDHRCHIAARTQSGIRHYNVTLSKGLRDRRGEDEVISRILIKTFADICGVPIKLPLGLNEADEKLEESREVFSEDVQLDQLIRGTISMIKYPGSSGMKSEGRRVVLSGSFNPVHDGHLKLLDIACSLCDGGIPCFELAVVNADKPPLAHDDIRRRVKQFQDRGRTIIVTNEPFFYKKADILPDSTFVVGVDTAVRLINPKYYDGSKKYMLEELLRVGQLGCDFLVAGRKVDSKYRVLGDLDVPQEVQFMFKAVPDDLFRVDISSTELRKRSGL